MTTAAPNHHPLLPLPAPLRGCERPSFAHHTITQRLPGIAQRVLAENELSSSVIAALEQLIAEIPAGPIRHVAADSSPDYAEWTTYVQPYLGQNWLDVPWFFVETYFYRRILEATGYFQQPIPGPDPFAWQKHQGLTTTRIAIQQASQQLAMLRQQSGDPAQRLLHLLTLSLWGNQADLSLWPAAGGAQRQPEPHVERILVNDAHAVYAYLDRSRAARLQFDFILDNAGFELISDLCLADFLLSQDQRTHVCLHVKPHPTFVSDATQEDMRITLAFLANDSDSTLQAWADRLQSYFASGRLQLHTSAFWTSPLSLWEMPAALRTQLAQSTLLISKGDANYRRLLGDRHWSFTTPFSTVLGATPAPLLALRTLKSELVVGLTAEQIQAAQQRDPTWLTNGNWGLIQFTEGA